MAVLVADEMLNLLAQRGWNPRVIDERTFRCTLETAAGDVRVVLRHAGPWLYLAVLPFLEPGSVHPWGNGKYPPRFLGRILAVNFNLALVKFALDDDGDLSLRTELPTESLQFPEIETALQMLVSTTEQYRQPIRDALLDAGRLERPSLLPDPPASEPPPVTHDEPVLDAVIDVKEGEKVHSRRPVPVED